MNVRHFERTEKGLNYSKNGSDLEIWGLTGLNLEENEFLGHSIGQKTHSGRLLGYLRLIWVELGL